MLEVRDLNAFYGESHIVRDVSFKLDQGRCLALLGRNGAGKTTTLRAILGYVPRRNGSVLLDGVETIARSTSSIVRRGLSYVPENRGIFKSLTTLEHLLLAEKIGDGQQRWTRAQVYELFPRLAERQHALAATLSGGEQQMLAIGRALMCSSRFVILDEPSEGLAPTVVDLISAALQRLKRSGATLLLVEQNYRMALSLLDDACVLAQGRVVFAGSKAEISAAPEMISNYIAL